MEYYIKVRGEKVPVSEEVYKAYCRGWRKERYFREGDRKNGTVSYDALDTEGLNGQELFAGSETVEEMAERRWMIRRLGDCMGELSGEERELLRQIYLCGASLRAVARQRGIPVTTLQYRHRRLLEKLKGYLERGGPGTG